MSVKAEVMSVCLGKQIRIQEAKPSLWAKQEEAAFQEHGGVKQRGGLELSSQTSIPLVPSGVRE